MIPKKINIRGIDIEVCQRENLATDHWEYGVYIPSQCKIVLDINLSDGLKMSTFIHECIEAINELYDIGLKHHQINLLEGGIFQSGLIK